MNPTISRVLLIKGSFQTITKGGVKRQARGLTELKIKTEFVEAKMASITVWNIRP